MLISYSRFRIRSWAVAIIFTLCPCYIWAVVFDSVSTLHIWITISSLANKDPNHSKSLLFRQIELNWINAPLDDENDYLALYLDGQPEDNKLPVSVHRVNNQPEGRIMTDHYLPLIDFYNQTSSSSRKPAKLSTEPLVSGQLKSECLGYCLAYHSRGKLLARNCLKTSPQWMRDSFQYISSRSLPSIMIPGSHNSGTYPKQLDKSVLHMISKYQMNQDESIFNQLVYGIRHLDLRVGYNKVKQRPEKLWIYHDIFRTEVSVNEVFEQVRRFLDLTSHEIIIMDFHRFTVGFQNEQMQVQRERHSKLVDLIFSQLGQFVVPSYLGLAAPIHELIAAGKRLVITYAGRSAILGDSQPIFLGQDGASKQVRDVDAPRQDQDDWTSIQKTDFHDAYNDEQGDRRMGTRIFNRLKTLKLISHSFSKRSIEGTNHKTIQNSNPKSMELLSQSSVFHDNMINSVSRLALFFPPVRHLWPNKDTLEGLSQYMNETTCRRYFGELSSLMSELTPTVFGAISDKYDGNRKLAQLVNRPVTDWIRDRWLHCINIVASDFFLGNDLIMLSIHGNKMRHLHQSVDLNLSDRCESFRKIEHLLDKSKIPLQFRQDENIIKTDLTSQREANKSQREDVYVRHITHNGNQFILRPLNPSFTRDEMGFAHDKRESFVDNMSDGFTNLISSFKRLFNF